MKRVRLLVVLVALVLAASLLSGCELTEEDLEDLLLTLGSYQGDVLGIRLWDGVGNLLLSVEINEDDVQSEEDLFPLFAGLEVIEPVCDPLTVEFFAPADPDSGTPEEVLVRISENTGEFGPCPVEEAAADPVPGPGPDMVPIPATAVVGTFLVNTPLHYAPAEGALADEAMPAGKTLYVFGVDESGAYYQVLLSGKFFWVPVEAMGPTYDDVWNGRPLPTEVVE